MLHSTWISILPNKWTYLSSYLTRIEFKLLNQAHAGARTWSWAGWGGRLLDGFAHVSRPNYGWLASNRQDKFNREIDFTNTYILTLPHTHTYGRAREIELTGYSHLRILSGRDAEKIIKFFPPLPFIDSFSTWHTTIHIITILIVSYLDLVTYFIEPEIFYSLSTSQFHSSC